MDTSLSAPVVAEFRFPHLPRRETALAASRLSTSRLALGQAAAHALTYGWDTAYAIRLPDVNAAIRRAGCSPKAFEQRAPDGSCSATGTFGDWQVCRGGDGVLIHMGIPLRSGTLSFKGQDTPLDGGVLSIEVQLRHIPPQPLGPTAQPSEHQLVMQTGSISPSQPAVSVIELKLPQDPGFVRRALISGLLQTWLDAHLDAFEHVFNTVTLNRLVDREQFKWLAPTHTSYAYANGATDEDSVFGVLCMTQGRADQGIASQLSPNAIPPGARSGLLISRERFLQQMVMPSLPSAFPGAKPSDFKLSDDGTQVLNTGPLQARPVTHAGTTYQPVVTSLAISVIGEEVIVASTCRTDIGLGTYSEVHVTSYQRLKVANKPDGTQTLVYEATRPPIQDHSTRSSAEGEALKVVLAIAGVLIGLVLTVLTDGAFLIIGLVIVALLVGLAEALPQVIADAVGNRVSNDSPSLALLVSNATSPIRWPGGKDFRLTWAGLNDSLQLGGEPGFA